MSACLIAALLSAAAPDLSKEPALPRAPAWEPPVPGEKNVSGIRLAILPQTGVPLIHAVITVQAGSDQDPKDAPGLAALTATFLKDGGAGRYSGPELAQAFGLLGTELEVEPSLTSVHFAFTVLAKNFDAALGLAADVIARPRLDPKEFPATRSQRVAEVQRSREDPHAIASAVFARAVYGEHPYGHPVEGTPQAVEAATVDAVKAFHAAHYGPRTVAVVVLGDLEPQGATASVKKAFEGWKSEALAIAIAPAKPEPPRFWAVDRPQAAQSEIRAGSLGVSRASPDLPALLVVEKVFGGSFTSRLNQNLRERHGYTYGAFAGFQPARTPGPFGVVTAVRTDATELAMREIARELEAIRAPLTPAELDKGRTLVQGALVESCADGAHATELIAEQVDGDVPLDDWRKILDKVRALTGEGAKSAAERWFPGGAAVSWVVVGDRKAIEPGLKRVHGMPKLEWVDVDAKPAR